MTEKKLRSEYFRLLRQGKNPASSMQQYIQKVDSRFIELENKKQEYFKRAYGMKENRSDQRRSKKAD